MKTEILIAWRYLFARKSHNVINVISFVSAAGLAVGSAALILILSVYNGFSKIISDNLADIDPDIRIEAERGQHFNPEDLSGLLNGDARVKSCEQTLEFSAFSRCESKECVARIKGVSDAFIKNSSLAKHIVRGTDELHHGELSQAILGSGIASELNANPRFVAPIDIYYPDREKNVSIANPLSNLNFVRVYTGGIFSINAELDAALIIVPFEVAEQLYGENLATALEIKLTHNSDKEVRQFIKELKAQTEGQFRIMDRYEQHKEMYKMMRLEKMAVFFILALIVLIVAFNIFGSLSMLIIEKEEDIKTLEAMGAGQKMTRKIFIIEGWMISLLGMFVGLASGICITLLQQEFGLVRMPGNYLVDSYPVLLEWTDVIFSALVISAIGFSVAMTVTAKAKK